MGIKIKMALMFFRNLLKGALKNGFRFFLSQDIIKVVDIILKVKQISKASSIGSNFNKKNVLKVIKTIMNELEGKSLGEQVKFIADFNKENTNLNGMLLNISNNFVELSTDQEIKGKRIRYTYDLVKRNLERIE